MSGLSTTGSISLGLALVAGRKRVPRPATGNTAVRITDFGVVLIGTLLGNSSLAASVPCTQSACRALGKRLFLALFRPFEDRGPHAVPRPALGAAPVPAYAEAATVIALIASTRVADARQERTERAGVRGRFRLRACLARDVRQPADLLRRQRRRQQPRELPGADRAVAAQPLGDLLENILRPGVSPQGQH